jgi:hypothetical protein
MRYIWIIETPKEGMIEQGEVMGGRVDHLIKAAYGEKESDIEMRILSYEDFLKMAELKDEIESRERGLKI